MLLVFLLLQLIPAPIQDAMADKAGDGRTWAVVRTELDSSWTVANARPESRPVTITLSRIPTTQPSAESRNFSMASSAPSGSAMWSKALQGGLDSFELPAATSLPGSGMAVESSKSSDSALPAMDFGSSSSLLNSNSLLGDMRHTSVASLSTSQPDVSFPTDPGTDGPGSTPGGPGGGVGGGIGSPIPEPSTVGLLLFAIPLVTRRRAKR